MYKNPLVKHAPLMVQVASLMLTFMKPGEVFAIIKRMVQRSQEAMKDLGK